ncbi:LBP_cg2779 family protein [Lacticaseibacillus hulanensis]|uniref:LBP_cg2779 family protein n=1 Tax=Lacticaseibacillus hulanensis TaxID=2493111 RepID=UPI000FD7FBDF|nr:LBP_cg2779 family protein [Lacticaseibacillus hulanensis]
MGQYEQLSDFAREIVEFQRKNNLTDTEMALNSHVSVEHIHNIKAMREEADPEVVASLQNYMAHKPKGK